MSSSDIGVLRRADARRWRCGAPHDIDVMVLAEPDVDAVYEACTRVEAAVHRPVNLMILTPEDLAASAGFLDNVRSGRAVAVIGELAWR